MHLRFKSPCTTPYTSHLTLRECGLVVVVQNVVLFMTVGRVFLVLFACVRFYAFFLHDTRAIGHISHIIHNHADTQTRDPNIYISTIKYNININYACTIPNKILLLCGYGRMRETGAVQLASMEEELTRTRACSQTRCPGPIVSGTHEFVIFYNESKTG